MKTEMGKGSLHGERKQATREELKEVHGKDWKRGRENNESEKRQEAFAELAKYADSADEIDNDKFEPDLLGHAPAFLSPLRRTGGSRLLGISKRQGKEKFWTDERENDVARRHF